MKMKGKGGRGSPGKNLTPQRELWRQCPEELRNLYLFGERVSAAWTQAVMAPPQVKPDPAVQA